MKSAGRPDRLLEVVGEQDALQQVHRRQDEERRKDVGILERPLGPPVAREQRLAAGDQPEIAADAEECA